jgi:hypothetical protein
VKYVQGMMEQNGGIGVWSGDSAELWSEGPDVQSVLQRYRAYVRWSVPLQCNRDDTLSMGSF